MNAKKVESPLARRSFLARLGTGIGVVGVSLVKSPVAAAQVVADTPWRPARHIQDDWLDKIPGVHRLIFDTTTADNMALSLLFATNYFAVNQVDYGLKNSDLAVVIVARHKSTSFGYNDGIWAKYSKQLSEHAEFTDPKTKEPPTTNVYTAPGDNSTPPGLMNLLVKRAVQFAVCQVSTGTIARKIAQGTGANADSVVKEITANLVGNARMVPAGIVAVNRAQERGYSLA